MPLYEFECSRCQERVEGIYPMGLGPARCGCGGEMQRLISKAGVRFIENENGGGGWSGTSFATNDADYVVKDGQKAVFPHRIRNKVAKAIV